MERSKNLTAKMNTYLSKHKFCERQISEPAKQGTNTIIVIPCYNEPQLLRTLQTLQTCKETIGITEIIVVINSGEYDYESVLKQNQKTFDEAAEWIKKYSEEQLIFHLMEIRNLPKKHAGVGLARKIGMDEAAARLDDINNSEGIIVCLDADCTVEKNYLTEIESHFYKNPSATGCSIYFEHPLSGNEFEKEVYNAIINYELFLRYYNLALQYCGFPYAFHTIGSCMAVRSKIYQKQGGMNRRKAGEDFYFLHKIFPLGNFTGLNSTCVYPSPRESDRVPFGTGSAIKKFLQNDNEFYSVYHIQTFIDLKSFFQSIHKLYYSLPDNLITSSLPESTKVFLAQNDFGEKWKEIKIHSASEKMFVKRFFQWFDGFMVLKFVHFARDNFYKQQEITEAAKKLLELMNIEYADPITDKKELLFAFRKWERNASN